MGERDVTKRTAIFARTDVVADLCPPV